MYAFRVVSSNLQRLVRVLEGLRASFDHHMSTCGDRVLAIALSHADWLELGAAEIWGVPVLSSEEIDPGRVVLLCEAECYLIPPHETVEDLQDIWSHGIQPSSLGEAVP
jgi:hypothetical protein